uniref:NADH dehydrogenase subunit 2 n=1 Tax=Dichomitus squalens TaxID=114155 RepID=UPI0030021646|nr:NADH dehydrogenase subunit 2 [Dichomitus squalens]
MYLSIELQSFGVYILTTLYRDSESATSAGLKYFLLGSLSSCIILLGSGLVYTYTGLTNLESIYNLITVSENTSILQGLSLGIVFIIVGYLFKVSAAPLHNWAPDVYNDSPTIVTIWLTIMPKISILIFLLEIQSQIGNSLITIFSLSLKNLLLISSLLSLLIGTIVGLAQSKIKRLLAYSTISHIGFILLALAINTEQSIDSFLFYIIQYSITNLNTFLILIALGYVLKNNSQSILDSFQDIKYITELKGLFFNNPLLSLSLTICLFSMAGVPPLLGFFSKQFVLYSAMQSEYYFIGIIAIIVSVISASYYLKIIKVLHSESKEIVEIVEIVEETETQSSLSSLHSFMISTLTLFILLFILKPSILLNSTQLLALSLFYY